MIHLLRAAANALRKYLHCFLKMLSIFIRTFTANWKLLLSIDEQASSKIKSDKKECKISVPDEKHFHYLLWFFHPSLKILHTFQRRPSSNSTLVPSDLIRLNKNVLIGYSKQKIKKKRAKISSRFAKKQVQAFQVFEKISTLSGSIFSKKLAFLKPSTWTTGFLFFFFFFWKI